MIKNNTGMKEEESWWATDVLVRLGTCFIIGRQRFGQYFPRLLRALFVLGYVTPTTRARIGAIAKRDFGVLLIPFVAGVLIHVSRESFKNGKTTGFCGDHMSDKDI